MQSDAPQACLLGPILFTLFNYDFPSVALHSKVLIYAGDVKIFNAFIKVSEFDLLHADFAVLISDAK